MTMARRDQVRATLLEDVLRCCRRRRWTTKIADSTGASLTGGKLVARALGVRRLLRRGVLSPDESCVGILLPPSAAAVVTNLALALDRRVPVNLNYTLTSELLNHCVADAGIRHILTSRRMLDRLSLQLDAEMVALEDLAPPSTRRDAVVAAVGAYLVPVGLVVRILKLDRIAPTDLLTVLFTSGTTGAPKGAMITHESIATTVTAVDRIISLRPSDVLMGILPFFHSFGAVLNLWAPLGLDVGAIYHVNPLEAATVGRLCREHKGTILLATPTFLRRYLTRCPPEDFASLAVVVTGGEKLPADLADAFTEKFGVRPVQGYGTTEAASMVASNVPPSRAQGSVTAACPGETVGRPVPGARVRIVDLATGEELPPGTPGMMELAGPKVMLGYLGQPEATAKVMHDGWYVTGDLAIQHPDGCLEIVGREARFAKIGGEMVSHILVEEALQKLVVLSVPDPTRGERLVVVHTPLEQTPAQLRQGLIDVGLPNLFVPDADSFYEVDSLPTTFVGKIDVKQVKTLLQTMLAEKTPR
jgi:acyl-[acyl-carrier-protein]-phospholipid O-acyltransferase/long-chain-fatty-acid--[acyl-carrier-protein] ligase